jgi:MoaA/NifB/PqqE/SkfB family radical SAM enzyme
MNIPHDKFCVLPWVSLEASPIGTVRPCCLADDELVDDTGEKFSLLTADFADIQNSASMRGLREQFLAGEKPQTCRKCWMEERAGRTSKRMHTLDRMKHMGISDEWTADAKPLMFLDLKLGNICNLKCRICGSWSSSQFATEEINQLPREEQKQSFPYQMLKAGAWPRENESFWNEIDQCLNDIRYIEFTGGEPFMIQEHLDLLQRLVDMGVAHQIEIHYNTNGTQYPQGVADIWRHFRLVEIAFSIDDVEDRFEYQRSGARWADVVRNLQLFKHMRGRYKNIQLQACCTVNVFNVMYLETVAVWLARQNFDFVYWNMLHEAQHFSISSLPEDTKFVVTNRLRTARIPEDFKQEFQRIINFMNQGTTLDGTKLKDEIQRVDQRRQENFLLTFPELARALNYE